MPPTCIVREAETHCERSGDTGARALLLIHGSGGSAQSWPEQVKTLPGVDVIAVDLPGHGQSAGPAPDSVPAYAAWVADLVATLGLDRVTLCGHSLGGAIALTLALEAPGWLEGIVLVGTGARLRVNPMILETVQADYEAALQMMGQFVFGPDTDDAAREALAGLLQGAGADVLLNDFSACDRFDVMGRVPEIRTPTLVVAASHDLLTPLKYSQYLAAEIPGAELQVIDGAGHLMALEKAAEFAELVGRFLG